MSTKDKTRPTVPLSGWNLSPVPAYNIILLQPFYLPSPMDEQPVAAQTFAIQPAQARELGLKLLALSDDLGKSFVPLPPGMTN